MTNKLTLSGQQRVQSLLASSLLLVAANAAAFDSGSTNIDGAFFAQADTILQVPEDGIFNFTTFEIDDGATVTFNRNTANTPVVILTSGDVTINGTLDASGTDGADTAAAGNGNLGDDGLPGVGGPGGFDGGLGGSSGAPVGGNGLGPGGGAGGPRPVPSNAQFGCRGAGAGFATVGGNTRFTCNGDVPIAQPYGSPGLQPLIGGSGGGGGHAGPVFAGSGGGGGGGAIMIASSGRVTVTGAVLANGGAGGLVDGSAASGVGGIGGEGSGGAIRIVATTVAGNGIIQALNNPNARSASGSTASDGRIRIEAENMIRTAPTTPAFTLSGPQPIFLANIPSVRITNVAGLSVPDSPTGAGDVIIPEATPNPISIEFATTNIPIGNIIELSVTPQSGVQATVVSNAISGTDENGTATVSVDIPNGPSTLSASVTFTVAVASLQQDFSQFAQGNEVEKVRIDFDPAKGSMTTFIAANGDEFTWPSNTVAIN